MARAMTDGSKKAASRRVRSVCIIKRAEGASQAANPTAKKERLRVGTMQSKLSDPSAWPVLKYALDTMGAGNHT